MPFVAFLMLAAGVYLVDAAVQNRKPWVTLTDIIKDPSNARAHLDAAKGTGYTPAVFVPSSGVVPADLHTSATIASGVTSKGGAAVGWAMQQIGKPYRWGATGPDAFDCSGLVQQAYKAQGVNLPRTSYQMLGSGKRVAKTDLQVGDLVWPDLGHVQLYAGNGQVVEAPHTGAVVRQVAMYGFYTARRVT